jgi:hypothetical protein
MWMRKCGYCRSRLAGHADQFCQLPKGSEEQCGYTGRAAGRLELHPIEAMAKSEVSTETGCGKTRRSSERGARRGITQDVVFQGPHSKLVANSFFRLQSHSLWERRPIRSCLTAWSFVFVSLVALLPCLLRGQTTSIQIPSATPLSVQLPSHVPMKTGETVEGRLLYAVYVDNRIAIPAGTVVRGSVIQLKPDRSRRIRSRLRGDFTPFRIPVVRFDQLVLPGGIFQPIVSDSATDGVPILRLSPPPGKQKGSFIKRQIAQDKQRAKDTIALFTAPGRGDRLVQFLYTQLPYHPQRIETGTLWTVELAQPADLRLESSSPIEEGTPAARQTSEQTAKEKPTALDPSADPRSTWRLRAYLEQTISSAKEKPGSTFQARVAEPVFNADHTLAVPEGSLLIGQITQAKPARSFGRPGKLRFSFREMTFPSGFSQPVEGTLAGIDANKSANLQMDSEGGVQQNPQNRVIVPLVLTLLAGRAFDDDGSRAGNSAVASNGFGIVGRVAGILASSRNVAAGIGIYGAALSFYDRWLARGHDVAFVKNTRIEITTTPSRNPMEAQEIKNKPAPSQ